MVIKKSKALLEKRENNNKLVSVMYFVIFTYYINAEYAIMK